MEFQRPMALVKLTEVQWYKQCASPFPTMKGNFLYLSRLTTKKKTQSQGGFTGLQATGSTSKLFQAITCFITTASFEWDPEQ